MKKIYFALIATLLLTGCESGDDLGEIFLNKTWKLSFFQEGRERNIAKEGYSIRFYESSFTANTPSGAAIVGNWQADNKNRTLRCTNVRVGDGSIAKDTTATKMKLFLEKSSSYNGDANWLQIRQQDNVYMQFHNR
ncbi:MAG: hypothetical protein IIV57_06455 [Bacteroidaceae bacterium]|nr:hypothetical protein [Bacteroidaceae bacterium]